MGKEETAQLIDRSLLNALPFSLQDWHRFSRPRSLFNYTMWVHELEQEGWRKASGLEEAQKEMSKLQWQLDR